MSGVFPDHQGLGGELDPGGQSRLLGLSSAADHTADDSAAVSLVVCGPPGLHSSLPDSMSQRLAAVQSNAHFPLQSEPRETSISRTRETVVLEACFRSGK